MKLTKVKAIGVSAMMHGYLAFDKNGKLLTPFCTWRNTITGQATAEFGFSIFQRRSIAHLHHAIQNGEKHVREVTFLTTLADYGHWKFPGQKVIASAMFPICFPLTVTPILLLVPVFLLLGCALPLAMYRAVSRLSVVERLREVGA